MGATIIQQFRHLGPFTHPLSSSPSVDHDQINHFIFLIFIKVLIKENEVIYQSINQLNSGWCHTVIKFHLHYFTVTLLNNSVELSSNLDKPAP